MAPLRLFGRDWRVGSDDLVCPAITELSIRLGWVAVVVAVIIFHVREAESLQCLGEEYAETTYYLAITLGILLLLCVTMLLLATHSARGSLSDAKPRGWVAPIIYANVFLTVTELLWTIVGTYFTIHDFLNCYDQDKVRTAILAVLVVIGLSYVMISVKIVTAVLSFRPSESTAQNLNYRSLQCLMPCTRDEGSVQAFRDIASLLSKVMHDPSLVPSDLVAGLLVLAQKQNQPQKTGREGARGNILVEVAGVSVTAVRECGDTELASVKPSPDIAWGEVQHFYSYASAAYGYWWYVMQAPCAHSCSLGAYLNCCPGLCCLRRRTEGLGSLVEGDGVFHFNTAAMRAMLEKHCKEEDILMVDNRNNLQEVPFLLVADRSSSSLVISIRGTLSLADMVTDLRGEPAPMASACGMEGLKEGWSGHDGICRAARYVYRRLNGGEEEGVLARALQQTNYSRLVVTGHSLGAGTAAILAFLLRQTYPRLDVTCYAYSPPGGLLSAQAARESEKFCVSVVVGDDVIPRTSLANIVTLSKDIKRICRSCSLPKYKLFGYSLLGCCCAPHVDLADEVNRLFPCPSTPTSTRGGDSPRLQPQGSDCELLPAGQQELQSPTEHPLALVDSMLPPGRVLHITRDLEEAGTFRVQEVAKTAFDEILISTRMLADHMPNYLHQVFNSFTRPPLIQPIRT